MQECDYLLAKTEVCELSAIYIWNPFFLFCEPCELKYLKSNSNNAAMLSTGVSVSWGVDLRCGLDFQGQGFLEFSGHIGREVVSSSEPDGRYNKWSVPCGGIVVAAIWRAAVRLELCGRA